ncbi:DUF4352 domain-containing protein [Sphingobacterium kyonggiense]
MKVIKYIIGVLLIIASIGGLKQGSTMPALLIAVLGALILPPVSDWMKSNFKFWTQKPIRYVSYIIIFVLFASTIETSPQQPATVYNVSEQNKTEQSNSQPQEPQIEEELPVIETTEEKIIGIGQPTEVGNFIYTVEKTNFKKSIGDEFLNQQADGIYLLVTLSIKNISNESRTLDNSLFKLTDDNGTEYESSTDGSTALEFSGGKSIFLKQCQPNITTKGTLVFEVPQKGEYNLHLSGGFWNGNTVVIRIN